MIRINYCEERLVFFKNCAFGKKIKIDYRDLKKNGQDTQNLMYTHILPATLVLIHEIIF